MKGEFRLIVNGELKTFYDYRDIPEEFDHVIAFLPEIPPGPHTHNEHDEIALWNSRLQKLMEKERACSNEKR
jgi:hypothetical protein